MRNIYLRKSRANKDEKQYSPVCESEQHNIKILMPKLEAIHPQKEG
jgi:hypothetical protein